MAELHLYAKALQIEHQTWICGAVDRDGVAPNGINPVLSLITYDRVLTRVGIETIIAVQTEPWICTCELCDDFRKVVSLKYRQNRRPEEDWRSGAENMWWNLAKPGH